MSDAAVTTVVGVLSVAGALFFLVTAAGVLRARDAVSRVNTMGPATGVGLPLIIVAAVVHDVAEHGWSAIDVVKAVLAIGASLVVSSVGSNMLGRAAYRSGSRLDPTMRGNALEQPEDPAASRHRE